MTKTSISILNCDFNNIDNEIKRINNSSTDYIHLDIMDGNFVESISFGDPIIKAVRSLTSIPIEAHLMVDNPNNYVKNYEDIILIKYKAYLTLKKCKKYIFWAFLW